MPYGRRCSFCWLVLVIMTYGRRYFLFWFGLGLNRFIPCVGPLYLFRLVVIIENNLTNNLNIVINVIPLIVVIMCALLIILILSTIVTIVIIVIYVIRVAMINQIVIIVFIIRQQRQ